MLPLKYEDNQQWGFTFTSEKKDKILTHFCFNFPPFVVAQINNCNAQGKVTQKNSDKVKDTSNNIYSIYYNTFSDNLPLWLRQHLAIVCHYGYDNIDNILTI